MDYQGWNKDWTVKPAVTHIGQPVRRILLVGNSFFFYNCGVHGFVTGLAATLGVKLVMTLVGIGGASLYWHDIESYFRPGGLRSYTISGDGTNRLERIDYPDGRIFDAVVLCDSSQGPIHPELAEIWRRTAARACATVRAHGAQPLLYMTWAYAGKPEMTRLLADAITTEANRNAVCAIPAGLAFARSAALRPDLALIRNDNRHPTVAGTYLQACTIVASMLGLNPGGAQYFGRFDDLRLAADDAHFLQSVAWQTVCEYAGSGLRAGQ